MDHNHATKSAVYVGVGKTSLVHLICHNDVLTSPAYTIGCSVEVRLHDYNKAPSSPTYFIEFWDVGGTFGHEKGRSIFYNSVNGICIPWQHHNYLYSVLCFRYHCSS